MKPVGHILDPSKFTVVPKVAIIDEFEMTSDDGSFVANIDRDWIAKCVTRMNERESTTGDLCPGVIGHTMDGIAETAQPPVTAFLRNWQQDTFFDTGRTAAFADIWVYNEDVDTVRKYPRRSGEVWVNRHEVDPLSFLGATTPSRDLGMMMLQRGGDVVIQRESPTMPDDKKDKPDDKSTNRESSGMKEVMDVLHQLMSAVNMLTEKMGGVGPGPEATPAPDGAGGGELSDADIEKMLAELGGPQGASDDDNKSRKSEPPPEREDGYGNPGGDNTRVQMQREIETLKTQVAKSEIRGTLQKLASLGHVVDPDDAALVDDLASMPPEVRTRQLDRLKLSRKDNTRTSPAVESAVRSATDGTPKKMTRDDVVNIQKLARQNGVTFEVEAEKHGYQFNR